MTRTRLALCSLLCIGSSLSTQAQTPLDETWVEHQLVDCSAESEQIHPESVGFNSLDEVVDGDTASPSAEKTDGDAIFSFVAEAASSTYLADGGIVHLPMAGPYRETATISISQSTTVRGYTDGDAIITTDCVGSPPTAAFTISIGSGEVVILENLTIRGFTTAIDASGSTSGSLLILRNCVLEKNTTGILGAGTALEVRVHDSRIVDGTTGITAATDLVVTDSVVSGNSIAGIAGTSALNWHVSGSRIVGNGAGIVSQGAGTGTGSLSIALSQVLRNGSHGIELDNPSVALSMSRCVVAENEGDGVRLLGRNGSVFTIADSFIERNDDDGLFVRNGSGCGALAADPFEGVVHHSHVVQNLDDGIEIEGSGTGCDVGQASARVLCGILGNSIALNADGGLVETSAGSSAFHCEVGDNQVSYNTGGNEQNTGTACTGSSATANQVN